MPDKKTAETLEVRHKPEESLFSVRVLDDQGRELSRSQEPTLHAALVSARQSLRERIHVEAGAHKAEVSSVQTLIYDVFAEQSPDAPHDEQPSD